MCKSIRYPLILVMGLLIGSLNSRGSNTLPRLYSGGPSHLAGDTTPVSEPVLPQEQPANAPTTETVVQPIVKQVPKSRKKIKPAVVSSKTITPPAKIIKPKIVIRKINVHVP